jgi:hypothetical protein
MNKTSKAILAVALGAGLFIGGYYTCKKTTPEKIVEHTVYEKLPPIHDSIPYPVYISETVPVDPARIIQQCVRDGVFTELFPERIRTITDTVYLEKSDTSQILADWATKRDYEETLFDRDTLGTMTVRTSVQYNRLGTIHYDFTPVRKLVTREIYTVRKVLPFVGAGASTYPSVNAEAGLFWKQSWGLSVQGNYYLAPNRYAEAPQYDFGVKVLKMF